MTTSSPSASPGSMPPHGAARRCGRSARLASRVMIIIFTAAVLPTDAAPPRGQEKSASPERRITVVAERFSFTPSRIKVKRGETIEFVLMSEDTTHGFQIRDLGVNVVIPPWGKGEKRIKVHFPESGKYVIECSRACGAGHNAMRGLITVED